MLTKKIKYGELNSKAKEIYNYQKVSAEFADYGYTTMWLNNDWEGADFLAVHLDGETFLKVQLKSRLSFAKKYAGKDIYMCFREKGITYLYPHDELLKILKIDDENSSDRTWKQKGVWSNKTITKKNQPLLDKYKISS